MQEGEHPFFELALAHLSVCHQHAQTGTELAQVLGRLLDRLDAVVQVEGLAAARVLALQRACDQLLVVDADVGADRLATLRRRLDRGDVAQSGERHVQGARDRGGAEREHIHLQPE